MVCLRQIVSTKFKSRQLDWLERSSDYSTANERASILCIAVKAVATHPYASSEPRDPLPWDAGSL